MQGIQNYLRWFKASRIMEIRPNNHYMISITSWCPYRDCFCPKATIREADINVFNKMLQFFFLNIVKFRNAWIKRKDGWLMKQKYGSQATKLARDAWGGGEVVQYASILFFPFRFLFLLLQGYLAESQPLYLHMCDVSTSPHHSDLDVAS